jgi:hypothetical protein
MEKFSKENAIWEHYNLHDLNAWAGIFISKSMKEVLSEEDHIKSITKYFLLFLENAERFKKSFPELPWENPPVETTE